MDGLSTFEEQENTNDEENYGNEEAGRTAITEQPAADARDAARDTEHPADEQGGGVQSGEEQATSGDKKDNGGGKELRPYTDQFRRVQEENNQLYREGLPGGQSGERDVRKRPHARWLLAMALGMQIDAQCGGAGYAFRTCVDKHGANFNIIEDFHPQLFHDIFEIVRNNLGNGELVDLHDSYEDCRCFITEDGLSGFAIEPSGNLVSVYNANPSVKFLSAIRDYITEQGATHLDCYSSDKQPLDMMYEHIFSGGP